jgi:3-deoxy-manno-octulosonate cytidylyltransferase (CMP-KDO synthetase)
MVRTGRSARPFSFLCAMDPVHIIIPARYASSRFPGKPLVHIAGKSMLQRVAEQAAKTTGITQVIVATDDQRIEAHAATFARVVMTGMHASGTDRCAEAAALSGVNHGIVVNVQGDEPFIQPRQIQSLCAAFSDPSVQIASLMKPIHDPAFLHDSNMVKVVCRNNGDALYFSRQAIPAVRGLDAAQWGQKAPYFRHIGVYAFRAAVLQELATLPSGILEQAEMLEQLRWLEHGYSIRMVETDFQSPAVDSPEDLAHVENFLKSHPELA